MKVTFSESKQSFDTAFGEVHNVTDGGYERGYAEGYGAGKSEADAAVKSLIDRTVVSVDTNVETIGANAFYGCTRLTTARMPNATIIYDTAFRGCSSLVTVFAPKVNSLRGNVFNSCTALVKIDFPLLGQIYANAFTWCSSLEALILRVNKVCSMSNINALTNTKIAAGTGYIYVPSALVDSYKAATNWSTYAAQIRALEEYTVDGTTTGELDTSKI